LLTDADEDRFLQRVRGRQPGSPLQTQKSFLKSLTFSIVLLKLNSTQLNSTQLNSTQLKAWSGKKRAGLSVLCGMATKTC